MEFAELQKLVFEEYVKNGYLAFITNIKPTTVGDLLEVALVASEPFEAIEKLRKAQSIEEELADVVIRVMNYATRHNVDLERAILRKNVKNMRRPKLHGKRVL